MSVQETVDWANAANSGHRCLPPPTIVDDAQTLSKVRADTYDLVFSSHCLEHIPNVYLALEHWARVVKPGGWIIIFVPDACSNTMDNVRVTLPATHFEEEYVHRRAHSHELEHTVTLNRFLKSQRGNRSTPPWEHIKQASSARLQELLRMHRRPDRVGQGHVHAWDTLSLREMLRRAERWLPLRLDEVGSFQTSMEVTELRAVLEVLKQPSTKPHSSHGHWRGTLSRWG